MLKLILLSFCIHFFLLLAVLDTYFQTIIESDLPLTNTTQDPPAKRILLIIVDGLRAQAIFDENEYIAPFLTSMRKNNGSWGISLGAPPTESRIGHNAIISGFREDPRAIVKVWNNYPVKYDTVFEQSRNTWCVASTDGVDKVFTRYKGENVQVYPFPSQNTEPNRDAWSINRFKSLLADKNNSENFSKSGNIFAVLLPNLDKVAHQYTREYSDEVKDVDRRIENLTSIFKEMFPDNRTAFFVTSDHGMRLDHGHGNDSPLEISSPFICWGAGVNKDPNRKDLENIDIAPLISVLIGISFPTNSRGRLPFNYLNISREEKYRMLVKNLHQLFIIYEKKEQRLSRRSLIWHNHLNASKFKENLKRISLKNESIPDEAFSKIQNLMEIVLQAIEHVQDYHTYNIISSGLLGLIFWILYLLSLVPQKEIESKVEHCFATKKFILLFICYISSIIFVSYSEIFFFVYYLFPIGSIYLFVSNYKQFLVFILKQYSCISTISISLFVSFYLSIILGFYKREYFFLTFLFLSPILYFIPKYSIEFSETWKHTWFILCGILALVPIISFQYTGKDYLFIFIGGLFWNILNYYFLFEFIINRLRLRITTFQYSITLLQNICSSIALCIRLFQPTLGDNIIFLMITITLVPFFMIPFSMKNTEIQLLTIFYGMVSAFIIPSYPQDLLILSIFTMLLINYSIVENNIVSNRGQYQQIFRVCWIIIGLNIFCIAGILNLSKLDHPVPNWIMWSDYLSNFDFLPYTIFVVKAMVPLIFTACIFRYIVLKTMIDLKICFITIELFFSTMLFYTILSIKNTGSWLVMGTSMINFVIVNFFSLFISLFYFIAYLLMNFGFYSANEKCKVLTNGIF